jgi:hypothetical protein
MEEEGGLPRSVGAEQCDPLTVMDMEVDVAQRGVPVGIGKGKVDDLE